MIIEIIILLALLGSLTGFIYFVKHYFKTRKSRNNKKRMITNELSNYNISSNSTDFYRNILMNINWGKVIKFTFIIGLTTIIAYNIFPFIENKATSPAPSINDSSNMSIEHFFPGLLIDSSGHLSFWALLGIGGIFFFIMWKFMMPRFDYSI